MENRLYRPLQPRVSQGTSSSDLVFKRSRDKVSIACNACREKKSKCNGAKPVCSSCLARHSTCTYVSRDEVKRRRQAIKRENEILKGRNNALEKLLHQLQTLPEHDANAVLKRIRTATDIDPISLLGAASENLQSDQPSAQSTVLSLLPHIQSKFELALCIQHPIVYPNLDVLEESINQKSVMEEIKLPEIRPALLDELVHRKHSEFDLQELSIGFWTTVSVSDSYARGVISMYLEIDHPTIGTFDADLFIADLLGFRLDFCSPFLVSALLAFASQGYATKDPSSSVRSLEFEREAEKLLEADSSDSLTTLPGLALLSYSHGAHGQDSHGSRKYAEKLLQMGKRMRFFGVSDVLRYGDAELWPEKYQRALAAAAWGGFNTLMLLSSFYVVPPIAYPPSLPPLGYFEAPGTDPESEKGSSFSPSAHKSIYLSFCSIWAILSEILCIYRDPSPPQAAPLALAYSKYASLLELADGLPTEMARDENTSIHALFFHTAYHTIILEIFRPFLSSTKIPATKYSKTSTPSPEAIFAASVQQLKSLVVECIHHRFGTATIFWAGIGLMQVANAVLKNIIRPDWRYYFLFCIRSYQLLFPAFAVCEGIVQGLLAMAVEYQAITLPEALLIMNEFTSGGNFHSAIVHSKGGFVVDYDLAICNQQLAAVDAWVDKFQELDSFSFLTDGLL